MRKVSLRFVALPVLFFLNGALWAADNRAPLTRVQEVIALPRTPGAAHLRVELEGTVTFVRPDDASLFIQQDGLGIFVQFSRDIGLVPGDRVIVSGETFSSFRTDIQATDVRFLAHGKLPTPRPAQIEDLIQSKLDSIYVRIEGHVLAATMDRATPYPGLRFQMKVPHGLVKGTIVRPGSLRPEDILDADIEITGVAGGDFGSKMQMAGVWLDVSAGSNVVVKHPPAINPWSLPTVAMDDVIHAYRASNESQRVRITGTLTYYEPESLAVIEQDGQSMLIETESTLPLHSGMQVEAIGFPEISSDNVWLNHGQLRSLPESGHVQSVTIGWNDASAGKFAYELVTMEGQVVAEVRDSRVDMFVVLSQGHLFSATLRHSSSDAASVTAGAKSPEIGSQVRITGVCFMDAGNHWRDRLWFDLRMRSMDDIVVVQPPSWWTTKRLAYMTTGLSAAILLAVIWVGMLDRRLRARTASWTRQSEEDAIRERRLARQEQQRSRILEMISSTEPLPGVLREIQSMVSSRLLGATCWFELNVRDGSEMKHPTGPEIVFEELFSREGTSLGMILATPLRVSSDNAEIAAALAVGARLAELAIDTRRLYSDLRHRSEHDLLTDIPNRFSMEKHLDRLMQRAERNEGIFGLIYVDLDKFKQINDHYGHRTGDLYLQEVTRRMKLQLRGDDVLARIGGDEFIALVPILRSHADAEEIAQRLEHCFDEPFELDGYTILGSASVGLAVYPEDGTTKEGLQRSADAAMYAHKETRKRRDKLAGTMQRAWSEDVKL